MVCTPHSYRRSTKKSPTVLLMVVSLHDGLIRGARTRRVLVAAQLAQPQHGAGQAHAGPQPGAVAHGPEFGTAVPRMGAEGAAGGVRSRHRMPQVVRTVARDRLRALLAGH